MPPPSKPRSRGSARPDRRASHDAGRAAVELFAGRGYAAVAPDYVGDVTHFPSRLLAIPRIADWFDRLGR